MDENDKIYVWISNVIKSCNHPSHIEPTEVLITFYQKKGAAAYLVDGLRESLNVQVLKIQEINKNKELSSIEEQVWEMFRTGNHTVKQISERLNLKLKKCNEIIDSKLR